jgi:hypothetical protein
MDVRMIEALERQPPGLAPLAALRAATRQMVGDYSEADLDQISEIIALTVSVPEVRARFLDEFARTIGVMSEALAKRAGQPPDDLAVRTMAGAIIGVIMSVTMPWEGWTDPRNVRERFRSIDQALSLLEAGLPL